jgi:hypothetical protein
VALGGMDQDLRAVSRLWRRLGGEALARAERQAREGEARLRPPPRRRVLIDDNATTAWWPSSFCRPRALGPRPETAENGR